MRWLSTLLTCLAPIACAGQPCPTTPVGAQPQPDVVMTPTFPAPPEPDKPRSFACTAFCIGDYNCTSDGDSRWDLKVIEGRGPTATHAWNRMLEKCPHNSSVVSLAYCAKGSMTRYPAPLNDVCVEE